MLAELKDKAQVTIPKAVVDELGLKRGDMFEVVVEEGNIVLVPVVIYPKAKMEELEALASQALAASQDGTAEVFDDVEDAIDALHWAGDGS